MLFASYLTDQLIITNLVLYSNTPPYTCDSGKNLFKVLLPVLCASRVCKWLSGMKIVFERLCCWNKIKHIIFTALILVSLSVLVAWKNNSTNACFDSSFLICDGSRLHCCLPRSSVASPKAAIILIYKYITWVFALLHTQMKTHCHAVHKFISVHCQACAQTLKCSLSSDVLQYESRESASPHIVPIGTTEEEFCFSFESL